ncbi:hypothetical protein B5E60_03670 [Alistipes sp. An116]|uniref:tetratricopeptide repeat protein n=1 Tax=Alistipes sp. An116 TaxID=1965546 RepID=UPI000B377CD4|nr:tetratricopeptide repeat protein [Alistipes sp. An116]OUQ54026.1 hypothetical protein B5E60_03670 [Alistipes sp. An116]
MKRLPVITICCVAFFSAAFVSGKSLRTTTPGYSDTLPSVWFYTEGIKQNTIFGDTTRARELFGEAIRRDSSYAPAWFELAGMLLHTLPDRAIDAARRAWRLDTANLWYHRLYAQTLLVTEHYNDALNVYRQLLAADPKDPDNYRLVAALYEQADRPFTALITLDSAEVRFGRIPLLSSMKRQLLVATNQIDKAIDEARALVDEVPYDADNHVVLANLYAADKQDSLAMVEYRAALRIDSTNVQTLAALSDYYARSQDYRSLLSVTRKIFLSEEMPLELKVKRFENLTSDTRFYREYYFQLNDLAATLAIRYPNDPRVVELYAGHLIASGELEQALALYKRHLNDRPPVEQYYRMVIDIESYLQHPDSVEHYVTKALSIFPEKIDFHLARGHAMVQTKQYDKAIRAYRESLRYAATDSLRSVIWGMVGDTWHLKAVGNDSIPEEELFARSKAGRGGINRRDMKQCYKAYDRSLRYWADNTLVMNNYAYFLSLEERDLERALAMATRVTDLTDNNPTYLDTRAWVLYKMGRMEEARQILKRAVALDGQQSPELMVHYGDVLYQLGEQFMAEIYWQMAREKGYNAALIDERLKQPAQTKSAE